MYFRKHVESVGVSWVVNECLAAGQRRKVGGCPGWPHISSSKERSARETELELASHAASNPQKALASGYSACILDEIVKAQVECSLLMHLNTETEAGWILIEARVLQWPGCDSVKSTPELKRPHPAHPSAARDCTPSPPKHHIFVFSMRKERSVVKL